MKSKNQNFNNFYLDVDKISQKHRRGCCTCHSFAFLIILAAILVSFGAVSLLKKIKAPDSFIKIEPSKTALDSVESKTKNFLPVLNQSGELVLTEEELTSLLAKGIGEKNDFPIKNPSVAIDENNLYISGTYTQPVILGKKLQVNGQITSQPYVENGELKLKVTQIEAGKLKINEKISDRITKTLQDSVVKKVNNENISYQSVKLEEKQMKLVGAAKTN